MKSLVHLKYNRTIVLHDCPFPRVRVWNHALCPVSRIHPVFPLEHFPCALLVLRLFPHLFPSFLRQPLCPRRHHRHHLRPTPPGPPHLDTLATFFAYGLSNVPILVFGRAIRTIPNLRPRSSSLPRSTPCLRAVKPRTEHHISTWVQQNPIGLNAHQKQSSNERDLILNYLGVSHVP